MVALDVDSTVFHDILVAIQDEDMIDLSLEGHDGIPVLANRFLLAARSRVLRRMLYGNFREAKSSTITLQQFDSATLEAVVEYCAKNEIPKFRLLQLHRTASSARRLVHLFQAADFLELHGLADLVTKMAHNLCTRFPPLACAVYDEADLDTVISRDALLILQCRPYVTLPPHKETGGGIQCLSEAKLVSVMKDDEIKAGELFLFKMLEAWTDYSEHYESVDAARIAKACGELLKLEYIEPQELLGPVQSSGFCSIQKITEAITVQALKASQNRMWSLSSRGDSDSERILVEGAGTKDVNGFYYRIQGLANGVLYSKREVACGQPYVYTFSCTERNKRDQRQGQVECRIFCSKLLTHKAVARVILERGLEDHNFQPLMQVFMIEEDNYANSSYPSPTTIKDDLDPIASLPKILLSDGTHYITATMTPELSMSARRNEVRQNSLIKLLRYEALPWDGKVILKLRKVSLISQDPGHIFGNPIDFYDALEDDQCYIDSDSSTINDGSHGQPALVQNINNETPIETEVCREIICHTHHRKQSDGSGSLNSSHHNDDSSNRKCDGLLKLYSCHYPAPQQYPQHGVNNSLTWTIPRTGWTVEVNGEAPGPHITWIPAAPTASKQQQQQKEQRQEDQKN